MKYIGNLGNINALGVIRAEIVNPKSAFTSRRYDYSRLSRTELIALALVAAFVLIFRFPTHVLAESTDSTNSTAATDYPTPTTTERGRVQIIGNNLVTDHGDPLRGEHLVFGTDPGDTETDSTILYDEEFWRIMRDDYRLNVVRLLLSQPPQNWDASLGSNCAPPIYRCYPLDYIHANHPEGGGKTTLEIMDDLVAIAGRLGMYIIIDYHPVLGYNQNEVFTWWAQVAPRYADRTHVIYEASNEPHPNIYYPQDLVAFQETLYQQIRADAPNSHIILWSFANTGADMTSTVDLATQIDYQNASVGYHPYDAYQSTSMTDLRAGYPIIATEIGGNRVTMTTEAEAINASWIWLDGVALKPGLEGATDNFLPEDVTWAADPHAVDQPPAAVTLISPTGSIPDPNPTFEWSHQTSALSYTLVIYNVTADAIEVVVDYEAGTICSNESCVTPPILLDPNAYTWLVRAINLAGSGTWSVDR